MLYLYGRGPSVCGPDLQFSQTNYHGNYPTNKEPQGMRAREDPVFLVTAGRLTNLCGHTYSSERCWADLHVSAAHLDRVLSDAGKVWPISAELGRDGTLEVSEIAQKRAKK